MISRFVTLVVFLTLAAGFVACASTEGDHPSGAVPARPSAKAGFAEGGDVRWFYVSTVTDPPYPSQTGGLRKTRAEAERDLSAYLEHYPYHRNEVYIRAINVTSGAILLNSLPWSRGESNALLAEKP
jgi:hypothetical protein